MADGHREGVKASSDSIACGSRNNDCTIICTWLFSARPYPTTLILTSSGEYSASSIPASATTSRAIPLTWASFSAVFTLAE